jgi:cellulose synthase/poly-beta-1,6-N-acetylglucosamine synthase-like glycosyltransferase
MAEGSPILSVVIPTMGRETLLPTVQSILDSDHSDQVEIIVAGSISDAEMQESLGRLVAADSRVRHLDVSYSTGDSSRKKNDGLSASRAEFVAFIDDDVIVAGNWPRSLLEAFTDDAVGLVGGPALVPDGLPLSGRLAGWALMSKASGYSRERLVAGKAQIRAVRWSRIIGCNMAYRKSVLMEIDGFNPRFWPGEEMLASYLTEKAGHTLNFNPGASVHHFPRSTIHGFWKQIYGYGATRIRLIRAGVELEPVTLVPLLFVVSTLVLAAFSFIHSALGLLLAFELLLYGLFDAWCTADVIRQSGRPSNILVFFFIPLMHVSYGVGAGVELILPNRDLSENAVSADGGGD